MRPTVMTPCKTTISGGMTVDFYPSLERFAVTAKKNIDVIHLNPRSLEPSNPFYLTQPGKKQKSCHVHLIVLAVFAAFLFFVQSSRGDQIIEKETDLQFNYAEHLFSIKDYISAVNEYRRFIFLYPQDDRMEPAMYRIGLCYLSMGQFELAIQSFSTVIDAFSDSAYAVQSYFRIGEAYFKMSRTGSAITTLHSLATISENPDIRDEAYYRIGWIYLETAQWERATAYFEKISPKNAEKYQVENLAEAFEARSSQKYKRPGLAGLLSIVPGGGYLYCGRYQDALMAFLLNGGLIYAAYEAFDHELYALAGVISFVEVGFYSGNVYGAVSSAHKYNQVQDKRFIDHLKESLKIRISARPANKGLELALRISF
jgi:TolA-binding protein